MSAAATGMAARPKVWFVGAGPGAADLLTFRGAAAIAAADVVVWAGSLVDEAVLRHARPEAERLDSSAMTLEQVAAVYDRAAADDLVVARVHSGDPTL
jgi:precorrin-4/cobalt-precorrin-4 C11-methyltransferase